MASEAGLSRVLPKRTGAPPNFLRGQVELVPPDDIRGAGVQPQVVVAVIAGLLPLVR
jgi:hypothetical protein